MANEEKEEKGIVVTEEVLGKILSKAVEAAVSKAVEKTGQTFISSINELKKPYVDPVQEARDARHRKQQQEEVIRTREFAAQQQENCSHKRSAPGGITTSSIRPVYNTPDRRPYGICVQCQLQIFPERWEVDAYGEYFKVPAHPLYPLVIELANTQMEALATMA